MFAVLGTKYVQARGLQSQQVKANQCILRSSGIFATTSFQQAIGAGWIILSIIDVRAPRPGLPLAPPAS